MAGIKSKLTAEEKRLRYNASARAFWANNKEAIKQRRKGYAKRQFESGALVHRDCKLCSTPFSYPIGRGTDRVYCSDHCRTKRRISVIKAQPLCVVEGCANPRFYSDGVCNSCYYRRKRTGTLEKRVYKYRGVSTTGYVYLLGMHDHPLCSSNGRMAEHRKILYDHIGPGPHKCFWCKSEIDWIRGRCLKGSLVPDHLDGNKQNNDINNLVPSCNDCNSSRGLFMAWVTRHKNDPVIWGMYEQARSETNLQQLSMETTKTSHP